MKIHPPALVLSETTIDKIDLPYLVVDKRFAERAYRDVLIVDSDGHSYNVARVIAGKKLQLWQSIQKVGLIVRAEPILNKPIPAMDLEQFKQKLAHIVDRVPYRFGALSDRGGLVKEIHKAGSFRELVGLF